MALDPWCLIGSAICSETPEQARRKSAIACASAITDLAEGAVYTENYDCKDKYVILKIILTQVDSEVGTTTTTAANNAVMIIFRIRSFLNPLDLSQLSIVEITHRTHLEMGGKSWKVIRPSVYRIQVDQSDLLLLVYLCFDHSRLPIGA